MKWWFELKHEVERLTDRLKSAEDSIRRYQRYAEIHYQTQLVMQRELANAHAALRRKGKALKILHKRIQSSKKAQL